VIVPVFESAGELALEAGFAVSRSVVVSALAGAASAFPALSVATV
jgi:hypothetical protein